MADAVYEVFALRYGHAGRQASQNFIAGDSHDGPMPMDYFVWMARSTCYTVVVDTGFSPREAKRRRRDLLRSPDDALALLGVDASAVKDVILTHLHYDHAGNCDLFPNARFHVQARELAYATGRYMCHAALREAFDVESVVGLVRLLYAGRVVCCSDGDPVTPGITVHHIGGHTAGLQVVRVETARGPLLLASDASHYYANFEQGRPFPIVVHVGEMLEGYDRMRRLVAEPARIVPGHDPLVIERFPAPEARLEGAVVRLDLGQTQ